MKLNNIIKTIAITMSIFAFIFILKSCKKVDASAEDKSEAAIRADVLKAIKAEYGNVTGGQVFSVNKQPDQLFYQTTTGGEIKLLYNTNPQGEPVAGNTCINTCKNTTDPTKFRVITTLQSVQRFYQCESNGTKSDLRIKWIVSLPTGFMGTGSQFSSQGVKINAQGSAPTLLSSDGFETWKDLGVDPACAYSRQYEVTVRVPNVAVSYFGSGMQLSSDLKINTSCGVLPIISTGFVNAPPAALNTYQPCGRVDKVYVNPNTGPSNCATAGGNTITCAFPTLINDPIDLQQVEYRKVTATNGSLEWGDQNQATYAGWLPNTSTRSFTLNPSTGILNLINIIPSIPANSVKWLVRYRNIKTGSCNQILSPITPGTPAISDLGTNAVWGLNELWFTEAWVL
jgi:hypothetical protein